MDRNLEDAKTLDEPILHSLAIALLKNEYWSLYLTPEQKRKYINIINDVRLWNRFINVRNWDTLCDEKDPSGGSEEDEELDMTTLFRCRCMLYDAQINGGLFATRNAEGPSSQVTKENEKDIPHETQNIEQSEEEKKNEIEQDSRKKSSTREINENDYDEPDSDANQPKNDEKQEASGASSRSFVDLESIDIDDMDVSGSSTIESSKVLSNIAYNYVYYTLEDDLLDQDEVEKLETDGPSSPGKASFPQNSSDTSWTENFSQLHSKFGHFTANFKNLLKYLENNRNVVGASDAEIKQLLADVRKSRSKWANEQRIGQEELYEGAEKVIMHLRNYTEHSLPFLTKVSKRDAPDYYNVIKEPMDLGTMLRKLKALQYNSKKEIVHDLMLIWSNCLTYNSHPEHPLRAHALIMKKKSQELLNIIPDIVIQSRKDYDETLMEADLESDEESSEKTSKHTTSKKTSSRGGQSKRSVEVHTDVPNSPDEGDKQGRKEEDQQKKEESSHLPPSSEFAEIPEEKRSAEEENTARAQNEIEDKVVSDVAHEFWKNNSKSRRFECIMRNRNMLGNLNAVENPSLSCRSPEAMTSFMNREKAYEKFSARSESLSGILDVSNLSSNYDSLFEYDVASGVPVHYFAESNVGPTEDGVFNNYLLWEMNHQSPGLSSSIYKNISKMQQIRKLCNKIQTVRQMQLPQPFYSDYYRSNIPFANEESILLDVPQNFEEVSDFQPVAHGILKKLCSVILFHAGFDSFHSEALNALTDVAADYMKNAGTLMKKYLSEKQKDSKEEIINQTLQELGVSGPETLVSYVFDDIKRYGIKLDEVHQRLHRHLVELLRPALSTTNDEEEIFGRDSDSFITGGFSYDTGDDFFGLRELGLEKELGLDSLSVPLHLLQSRLRLNMSQQPELTTENTKEYPPAPRYPPITRESLKDEIGLIQGFLSSRMDEFGLNELIEDEDIRPRNKPPRPRLPPNGKITTGRKRIASSVFLNQSLRKKKCLKNAEVSQSNEMPSTVQEEKA
ncbi:SAGA complex bromodomain subunit Spt7 [Schizosaccharomyces cryophilus OY26]|uniref:SAGA complex subunit Spt7 n=1 Tax=Schizosaccharomyces cryophilus (strain OY26 / ATCC MYA-4695 / CBS 11777 / NBRC 106824 / NRRL Y48691) TaxID=653667 RepID=S9VWS6_SCHCR|nr:SAGA complex bromodomain subunit Spt7 [Schizosaccharomyces cryophilus OY26]EPY50694.1 SAGA complex bromodomain subunit Spt7 [Schizosaccharomyces cryophilus OY26]